MNILKRYSKIINGTLLLFLGSMLLTFILHKIILKFHHTSDFLSILKTIWTYPVFVKDNSAISLGTLVYGIVLVIFGYHASKFLSQFLSDQILQRFKLNVGALATVKSLSFYGLFCVFTLFALNTAHVPLALFTFFGGAFAIGIGFGSQNLMNNFISGILLQIEQPIRVGDTIEIDGSKGVVSHIGARRTMLDANNGTSFVIPNAHFLEKKVQNFNLLGKKMLLEVKLVLPSTVNISKLKELLEIEVGGYSEILPFPKPQLLFGGFLDSGNAVLYLNCWIDINKIKERSLIESKILYAAFSLSKHTRLVN